MSILHSHPYQGATKILNESVSAFYIRRIGGNVGTVNSKTGVLLMHLNSTTSLQLCFQTQMRRTYSTGNGIESERNSAIRLVLFDVGWWMDRKGMWEERTRRRRRLRILTDLS